MSSEDLPKSFYFHPVRDGLDSQHSFEFLIQEMLASSHYMSHYSRRKRSIWRQL